MGYQLKATIAKYCNDKAMSQLKMVTSGSCFFCGMEVDIAFVAPLELWVKVGIGESNKFYRLKLRIDLKCILSDVLLD